MGRGVGPGGSLIFELFVSLALESRKYRVNGNRDRKNIKLGKYSIFESQSVCSCASYCDNKCLFIISSPSNAGEHKCCAVATAVSVEKKPKNRTELLI